MDPRHRAVAERRAVDGCVYCGHSFADRRELEQLRNAGAEEYEELHRRKRTRDHVPSRAILDPPYPPDLPTVDCCYECNNNLSIDEQYLVYLLECVLSGETDPSGFGRTRVAQTISESSPLRESMDRAKHDTFSGTAWEMSPARVERVIMKLARGHATIEEYPRFDTPSFVSIGPLICMDSRARESFENDTEGFQLFPEIGSKAFERIALDILASGWVTVQPNRYRYRFSLSEKGTSIKFVIREYLACEVVWDSGPFLT